MPGMKTGMAFMKYTLTQWKASGHCCVQGLRSHRGIFQEKLPLYLGFFEFVHNARKRGKALLSALLECLLN
jgi:hypothetical protein